MSEGGIIRGKIERRREQREQRAQIEREGVNKMDEGKLRAELSELEAILNKLRKKRSRVRDRLHFDPEAAGELSRLRRDEKTVMEKIAELQTKKGERHG